MNASKMNRKPSMGDVAEAVGVSKTIISRYLHGEYAYMSSETKAKIEQVIRELGYRPNSADTTPHMASSPRPGVRWAVPIRCCGTRRSGA